MNKLFSAGLLKPSSICYRVVLPALHKTLRKGDRIFMAETPGMENLFIRVPEMTLHAIADDQGEYVFVERCDE